MTGRPSALFRVRGSFTNPGDRVYAAVPTVLHPLPENQLPTRLGLAHWLVDENNPLTARVIMNRIWELYFGRGIVETSEDFGTQGERPSHPELLDYLAVEFMKRGWSLKAMHRLIVMSATYRQSSKTTPALLEKDPYNRLFTRGPRFRMEGEMIRDVALAASGLLSRAIGGPSVFPYQPPGIWQLPYNDDRWIMSGGENRYRRGLYTFWRRSAPYPAFTTFDAPSREYCTVKRIRTNTPLQALTILNDPAFFDMARALGRRARSEGGVAVAFRLCVARLPKPAELERLQKFFEQQRDRFSKEPEASKLVNNGEADAELSAWVMVANVLLNLDETLTKE
jgi:hypothetical protein